MTTFCHLHRTFRVLGPLLFDASGRAATYQAIGRDVSLERVREARAREAQRLESLAVLCGGIAHDFNNLLMPILSLTELVANDLPSDAPYVGDLRNVLAAAERAKALVRQILTFSRRDTSPAALVSAGASIREVTAFLRESIPANIDVQAAVDTDCGLVMARPSDLFQIVSNLCVNAYQAMPGGGTLFLSASTVSLSPEHAEPTHLQIIVRDTGVGMEPATRARVFEPFFTTKRVGDGTGLGLSVVHGIVQALGGTIDVQSEVSRGTTFVVHLPLRAGSVASRRATAAPSRLPSWRVLVVDDEPMLTHALGRMLERLGVTVVARNSANDALAVLAESDVAFTAVVTDLTMPHMSGVELAWRIRQSWPTLPVVLMSGFGDTLHDARHAWLEQVVLLSKPLTEEALRAALAAAVGVEQLSTPPSASAASQK